MQNETTNANPKCQCGCKRTLKDKFVKLKYHLAFKCYYDSIHGIGKYDQRRINRVDKRNKRRHA